MFILIRKIHLYTSFAVAAFLFMYFITGSTMIMEGIFPRNQPKVFTAKQFIPPGKSESAIINGLCKQYSITGYEKKNRQGDGMVYRFTRPAYIAEITFSEKEDSVSVKISKGQFGRLMNDLHRFRGFDNFIHFVWGVFYDLSCIGLIVFAFTGMYMWLKTERKKLVGSIFLLASTVITFLTIWYLMVIS